LIDQKKKPNFSNKNKTKKIQPSLNNKDV